MRKDYQTIINYSISSKAIHKWKKRDNGYVIVRQGRWGWKWLHSLVWRMATNLGMLRHEKDYFMTEAVDRCEIPLKNKDYEKKIFDIIKPHLKNGYRDDDLTVVVGYDFFNELQKSAIMKFSNFTYPVHIGGVETTPRIFNIPIIVNPYMQGVVVIPKEILSNEKEDRRQVGGSTSLW